ncbi:MAG: hypothetical protein ACPGLY_05340 [Rubripirellula sp.]
MFRKSIRASVLIIKREAALSLGYCSEDPVEVNRVIQTDGNAEQAADQYATSKRFRQLGPASRNFNSITGGLTFSFMLPASIDVVKSDKLRPL